MSFACAGFGERNIVFSVFEISLFEIFNQDVEFLSLSSAFSGFVGVCDDVLTVLLLATLNA